MPIRRSQFGLRGPLGPRLQLPSCDPSFVPAKACCLATFDLFAYVSDTSYSVFVCLLFIYPGLSPRICRLPLLKLSLRINRTLVPFHERSLCLVGAYVMLFVFGPAVETLPVLWIGIFVMRLQNPIPRLSLLD